MKEKNKFRLKQELVEKVINWTLNILIGLFSIVLLVTLYNTIQIKLFKNAYSNFFGYSVFEIKTDSMAKTIFTNDWIIVKITNKVDVNDIITYNKDNTIITHRVVEKYNDTLITQGDANNSKDDPIDKKQDRKSVV